VTQAPAEALFGQGFLPRESDVMDKLAIVLGGLARRALTA
jgi:hypothetical protein